MTGSPDFQAEASNKNAYERPTFSQAKLGPLWFAVPGVIVATLVVVPLPLVLVGRRRARRAEGGLPRGEREPVAGGVELGRRRGLPHGPEPERGRGGRVEARCGRRPRDTGRRRRVPRAATSATTTPSSVCASATSPVTTEAAPRSQASKPTASSTRTAPRLQLGPERRPGAASSPARRSRHRHAAGHAAAQPRLVQVAA